METMKDRESIPGIEWAVAQRPLPGESVSGDHCLVRSLEGGVLLAAMDGLGHGPEAAHASRLAVDCLGSTPAARGLPHLVRECHEALRGSRGIALTLALYDPGAGTLQWLCIGNVEGVLWHRPDEPEARRITVTPRGGVVGYQIPTVQAATVEVAPGDVCCFATDGISSSFVEKTPAYREPGRLAHYILDRYGKATDDALVLAVRFGGAEP